VNGRFRALALRREALCARSEGLRDSLGADALAISARLQAADRLVAVARSGATRTLLVGAAAFMVVGRPRHVLKLAMRVLALWPLITAVAPRLRGLVDALRRPPGASV
jgi:hypothetical protein